MTTSSPELFASRCLDFERPVADLEEKINELSRLGSDSGLEIAEQTRKLKAESRRLTERIFCNLSDWQVIQLARHPLRPYCNDYVERIFTDFYELRGDRHFRDDRAIIGGIGRLQGRPVMVIGSQKGRDTEEKLRRNFGMPMPEGYRKALRLMRLAERFRLPIITLIDTPGAHPGVAAEERAQSESIAANLQAMSELKVPIVCVVTGEGGSGGALAIGVGDQIMMLEFAIYSVISPEGCAAILWRDAARAETAAESMRLTATKLLKQGIIDQIIPEPLGGAHRSYSAAAANLQEALTKSIRSLTALETTTLLGKRYQKIRSFGKFAS